MSDSSEHLLNLARAVSDCEPVDWSVAEGGALDEEERELVGFLRDIDEVMDLHRVRTKDLGRTPSKPADKNPAPGTSWGPLEIRGKLGEGAFAEVFRARDPRLDRDVALKLFSHDDRLDPERPRALLAEGRNLARLRHENVVTVLGADEYQGRVGIWMELVEGRTLSEIVKAEGPFSATEATQIGIALCGSMAAVHRKNLVHGDIKGQNVKREPGGRIVLMDFSSSRGMEQPPESDPTGTPLYMAPELWEGNIHSVETDIYSLGVLLYYLVTGNFPVRASSVAALREAHARGERHLLRDERPGLPEAFVRNVEKALSRDPNRRFRSAGELEDALRGQGLRLPGEGKVRRAGTRVAIWLMTIGAASALAIIPATRRWRDPEAPLQEHQRLLLADFENRTKDPFFDTSVRELLTLSLEQSRVLSILPREQLYDALKRMRASLPPRIDRDLAQELSLREGLTAFLSGEILPLEAGYKIVVQAVDPARDVGIAVAETRLASKSDLWSGIDTLGESLRRQLGEEQYWIRRTSQPLQKVTTASLPALERFSQAVDLQARGKTEEARVVFANAVEMDPDFTMAYVRLAVVENTLGGRNEALATIGRAYERLDRVTEREKYFTSGIYNFLRADYDRAADSFRALTVLHPSDPDHHVYLAQAEEVRRRYDESVNAIKRAIELQPAKSFPRGYLITLLTQQGRFDDALEEFQSSSRALGGEEHAYFHWGEGLAWLGKNDFSRARSAFQSMAKGRGTFPSWAELFQGQALVLEGRLEDAAEHLEADRWRSLGLDNEYVDAVRAYWLASIYLLLENSEKARQKIDSVRGLEDLPVNVTRLRDAALLYAGAGDSETAQELVERLEKLRAQFPSNWTESKALHARGAMEWAAGDSPAARRSLERAAMLSQDGSTLWWLARLRQEQGEFDEALRLYLEILSRKGEMVSYLNFAGFWVLSHLEAARCHRALGNDAEASRYYEAFLNQWGAGSHQLKLVKDALQERGNLPGP